jgi:hypothetical protein
MRIEAEVGVAIAFSIGATIDLSHGSTTSSAGSGTLMLAACASGVGVP